MRKTSTLQLEGPSRSKGAVVIEERSQTNTTDSTVAIGKSQSRTRFNAADQQTACERLRSVGICGLRYGKKVVFYVLLVCIALSDRSCWALSAY